MHYPIVTLCFVLAFSASAFATEPGKTECVTLAASVNDYGKKGPTEDAKKLLDKYIADYAKQRGIKEFTAGEKTVTCELYLDFGFFDEHTCKAQARVCQTGKP